MKADHSNLPAINKGGRNPADVIKEVLEIHRKSHHFSIKQTQPNVMVKLAAVALSIPLNHLEKSLTIFKTKTKDLGKSPHPNYFIAVANRLYNEGIGKATELHYIREHKNLGKSI
jgi:hypothetical protein